MDKLVKQIQANSSNMKDLESLHEYLKKNEIAIIKNSELVDGALEKLDPKKHTLGYAFLLNAKTSKDIDNASLFIKQCQNLFLNCNREQAVLTNRRFYSLSAVFTSALTQLNMPKKGLLPLKNALQVAREGEFMLTPIHADFLQLCILARFQSYALPIISRPVLQVAGKGFGHAYFLKYFYYGGLVFLAMKKYKEALKFFEKAVSVRAMMISAIMLEAQKKYILTSLIVNGSIPTTRMNMVQRHLKALTQPYQELATAYSTNSSEDVSKCIESNQEHFAKDNNLGLINQCVNELYNRNIKSYTKTYLTLSLKGIAEGAKIEKEEDAEKRLLRMIEKGDIYASVDQKAKVVSFSESPEKYNNNDTLKNLDSSIKHVIRLGDIVSYQDNRNALNFNYIQRTQAQEQRFDDQEGMGERGIGGMFRG